MESPNSSTAHLVITAGESVSRHDWFGEALSIFNGMRHGNSIGREWRECSEESFIGLNS